MSYREDRHQDFLACLSVTSDRAGLWCDAVRQERERHLGAVDTDTLVDDPEYSAALDVFGALSDVLSLARRVGA
ncbi:hypothetical protein [Amycolatopsis sp. VC5-11]|uniref:hypothetical protein n=1 Tax=Amycolatopsis sp. VC5-11 TaxID=3120156 RepID=UPI00300BD2BC